MSETNRSETNRSEMIKFAYIPGINWSDMMDDEEPDYNNGPEFNDERECVRACNCDVRPYENTEDRKISKIIKNTSRNFNGENTNNTRENNVRENNVRNKKVSRKKSRKSSKNTFGSFRVCFSVINSVECTNGEGCKFAHTLDQFKPKVCKYGAECKGIKVCDLCYERVYGIHKDSTTKTPEPKTSEPRVCECNNECTKLHQHIETKEQLLKRMRLFPKDW